MILAMLAASIAATKAGGAQNCVYSSDGDTNGVFHYVGVIAGLGSWTNPHTDGIIAASASNLAGGTLDELVDRAASDIYNEQMFGNWFKFDLISRLLVVTYWSFRQRSSPGELVTELTLQGSNDDSNWDDIDVQTMPNQSVDDWNSFAVIGETTPYRYLRFVRTALSTGGQNYYTAGEFELYGEVSEA